MKKQDILKLFAVSFTASLLLASCTRDVPSDITSSDAPSSSETQTSEVLTSSDDPAEESSMPAFMDLNWTKATLAAKYPDIHDWKVIFENDHIISGKSGEKWDEVPVQFVVLSTEESPDFDRVIINNPMNGTNMRIITGWEKDWHLGNFEDLELRVHPTNCNLYALYFPSQKRAILPYDGLDSVCKEKYLEVLDIENPPFVKYIHFFHESDYRLKDTSQTNRLVLCVTEEDDCLRPFCYSPAEKKLVPFRGVDQYCYFSAHNDIVVFTDSESLGLYDLSLPDKGKPLKILGGNGEGLADGTVYIHYQPLFDRNKFDKIAIMYFTEEEGLWRVCVLDTEGNILSDFCTGLSRNNEDWIAPNAFSNGLLYFEYYDGPDSDISNYRMLCVDTRPGKDHTVQRIK